MIEENDHDDLAELECELKRLRPQSVSRQLLIDLASRLEPVGVHAAGLEQAGPSNGLLVTPAFVVRWLLPAAAALVFGTIAVRLPKAGFSLQALPDAAPAVASDGGTSKASPVLYKPVSAEKLVYGDREESFVTLSDGTPARQLRDRYLDTITWRNPRTNASLTWSVPREEIRVIPISAY